VCVTEAEVDLDNLLWRTMFKPGYEAPKGFIMQPAEIEHLQRRFENAQPTACLSADDVVLEEMAASGCGDAMECAPSQLTSTPESIAARRGYSVLPSETARRRLIGEMKGMCTEMVELAQRHDPEEVSVHFMEDLRTTLQAWRACKTSEVAKVNPNAPPGAVTIVPQATQVSADRRIHPSVVTRTTWG
jgi:hypothetical protein